MDDPVQQSLPGAAAASGVSGMCGEADRVSGERSVRSVALDTSADTQDPGVRPVTPVTSPELEFFDFQAVVGRHESPLLRYVGQIVGPGSGQAQDIVQETFLRLHQHVVRHGPAGIASLPTWLLRVAHNLAIDALRQRQRRQVLQEHAAQEALAGMPEGQMSEGLEEVERREACRLAMTELHRLPEQQRHLVMLRMVQGLSFRQMSQVTGLSVGNVSYHFDQALRKLARKLQEKGVM